MITAARALSLEPVDAGGMAFLHYTGSVGSSRYEQLLSIRSRVAAKFGLARVRFICSMAEREFGTSITTFDV